MRLKASICCTSLALISAQGVAKSLEGKKNMKDSMWNIKSLHHITFCAPTIYVALLTRVKCRKHGRDQGRQTKSQAVLQREQRRAEESSWWRWCRFLPPVELHCWSTVVSACGFIRARHEGQRRCLKSIRSRVWPLSLVLIVSFVCHVICLKAIQWHLF